MWFRLRPESGLFTVLLSALGGLTALSLDMNLPALGLIGASLHVPASVASLTLSFFLVGLAAGLVTLGPLSDRFGRRPVLLGGCLLFGLAGLGCAAAPTFPALLAWRLAAGFGAAAGVALSLAMVRDRFDGAAARVKLSYVGTVGALAPMLAPSLGTLVLAVAGWRSIYGTLAALGFLLWLVVAGGVGETLRRPDPDALRPRRLAANYARIFRHPVCLGYVLVVACFFGCLFSYVSSSPRVMMDLLHVSRTAYGWTFAATSLGLMAGGFVNGRLSARGVAASRLMGAGLALALAGTLGLALTAGCGGAALGRVLPLLIAVSFSFGLVMPNANQAVLHPVPDIAGVASAVLNAARMLAGALASALVAFLHRNDSLRVMAFLMIGFTLATILAFAFARRAERRWSLPGFRHEEPAGLQEEPAGGSGA